MSDRVQPGAGVPHLAPAQQRMPGADAGLLHGVLCGGIAHELTAMREQQWPVTLDQDFKGALVTEPRELDQAIVGLSLANRPWPRTVGRAIGCRDAGHPLHQRSRCFQRCGETHGHLFDFA